jgi:hypothetical protein
MGEEVALPEGLRAEVRLERRRLRREARQVRLAERVVTQQRWRLHEEGQARWQAWREADEALAALPSPGEPPTAPAALTAGWEWGLWGAAICWSGLCFAAPVAAAGAPLEAGLWGLCGAALQGALWVLLRRWWLRPWPQAPARSPGRGAAAASQALLWVVALALAQGGARGLEAPLQAALVCAGCGAGLSLPVLWLQARHLCWRRDALEAQRRQEAWALARERRERADARLARFKAEERPDREAWAQEVAAALRGPR